MNRRSTLTLGTIALMCIAAVSPASAQNLKDQVIGAYALQSGTENFADGRKLSFWATGSLILAPSGHFSQFLIGKERAKTSDSVRTPVGPAVGYYGTYTIDEAAGVINLKIESGVTPQFDGAARQIKISVKGDVLTMTSPELKTPEGPMVPVNEWKKLK
jgi:Lipocalin-like domain